MPLDLSIFNKAVKAFDEGKIKTFTSLPGSSGALLFSMLRAPSLLLCPSEEMASEFYSDAAFWAKTLGYEEPLLIHPKGNPLRLKSLFNLYTLNKGEVITSVEAALSPLWRLNKFPLSRLSKGSGIDRDSIMQSLQKNGYHHVPVVSIEGEMSIRGGILDVFSPDKESPVRIEFFGDKLESLRFFDVDTQLTIREIENTLICPAAEPEEGPNLFDILSDSKLILNEPNDIKRRYPDLIPPKSTHPPFISFTSLPLKEEGLCLNVNGAGGFGLLREERKAIEDFVKRIYELREQYFILLVCSSEGQAKRLKELLDVPILKSSAAIKHTRSPVITTGRLSRGFAYRDFIILTERDIFGERPFFKSIKKSRVSKLISSIEDFKEGDYLVHTEHGIGRFLGIKKEKIEDFEGDFLTIEYLGGDRLYVPLERINYVQKYHAPENIRPKLDKLGGRTWQKTKQRVKQKLKDMAQKLVALYARRTALKGFAFSADTELHNEFNGFFTYEETPDQLSAIYEIKEDMESPTPMDRLLCGDVGYGKTEVAMRACFKAVYDSRQAAVLVPTTILAEQHYDTFLSRFSAFPIRIESLSRFKSPSEQKKILKALSEGEIDIIIGTNRLLGKDVIFYNLGLLIIDEEHKFGVAHKEKLKALRTNMDVLTLTATPIPRTLHMALSGIRSMSVIETPPEERLAVKSFVARFNPEIIKDALQKELNRGGQVFFIHNRIHDIHNTANFLRALLPDGKIAVAHGQMKGRELENVMRSFYRKEINILVSTAIIGSGLDIPTANTIIIDRADKFGLADLYQLRGRIGRSNVKAYAYFLIPGEDAITEEARKKLSAVLELSYLGAGFRLALKDLEIRGAGNLLGSEQSGHIEAVGYDLYIKMLEEAVAELKGEEVTPKIEPLLELRTTAIIPEDYIEDPTLRLSLYRKIGDVDNSEQLRRVKDELKDRFGTLPEETERLIEIMQLKLSARKLAVIRLQNIAGKIKILFAPETPVTPEKILSLYPVRKNISNGVKFLPEGGIELDLRGKQWNAVFKKLKRIMEELGG